MVLRILAWAVIVFLLVRFVAKIILRALQAGREGRVQGGETSPPEEDYRDVRDAKYVDVTDSNKDTPSDRNAS